MPSSPLSERSVCHSPSPSVTPQSAAATQSPLMHLSIPGHGGTPLPHTVTTSKGRHVILLSLHGAKKAPVTTLPRGPSTLLLDIDPLSLRLHSSTSLSVFLS